jgi:ATP-binding protein involved in chromosome partitioning
MDIRETSDAGTPVVVSNPEGAAAQTYRAIATRVWQELEIVRGKGARGAPAIVFE